MPSSERPPTLDPVAAARWAVLPVRQSASPWLHEEIASRMLDRLDFIRLQPQSWAHWEPLRGGVDAHQKLQQRYPKAPVWLVAEQVDQASSVRALGAGRWWSLSHWTGPAVHSGVPPAGAVQMLWANMLLHHAADPQGLIRAWHRALAVDGFLMFSCFGPDTLRELREIYAQKGWPAPAHEFTDMHDWGDMMVEVGFAEPVMDMERITLAYESAERLLQDLRDWGRNLHTGRFAGCRGRQWRAALVKALEQHLPRNDAGQMVLTIEVIYGHAYRAAPKVRLEGESAISVQDMRAMLRQPRSQ